MSRRMIWAQDKRLTSWCCSHCGWSLIAPRLESTPAVLAFNQVAQESFEKHASGAPRIVEGVAFPRESQQDIWNASR